jgi:hypothetical protein
MQNTYQSNLNVKVTKWHLEKIKHKLEKAIRRDE